jgi:hypothetical protein
MDGKLISSRRPLLYVISGRVIGTVLIHSREKLFKGLNNHCEMEIDREVQHDVHHPAARLSEKGCFPVWRCPKNP